MSELADGSEAICGAVVRLKSGGPPMTVVAITKDDFVRTLWFSEGEAFNGTFPAYALDPCDPD